MKIRLILSLVILLFLFISLPSAPAHADPEEELALYSEAVILVDAENGEVIYGKNADRQMYPASITKIVSGLAAIEEDIMGETAVISEKVTQVDGTRVYLLEGEEVPVERLIKGLLINSGNDAGTAVAEHIAGSESSYAQMMNELVKDKAGVTNTNFTNPHGLYHPLHVTTAEDMAEISRYAMQNDTFREIVGTTEMEWNGEGWETVIYNHHRMLGSVEGVTGIKNGYVSQAGATLVTSAERDGHELIAVTLKAPSADESYRDTRKLLEYGFEHMNREEAVTSSSWAEFLSYFSTSETASAESNFPQKTVILRPATTLREWKSWNGEFIYQPSPEQEEN